MRAAREVVTSPFFWGAGCQFPTTTMLAPVDAVINSVNNVCAGVRLRIAPNLRLAPRARAA